MKHLETPWNRAMKHRETEWNSMKQQWNSMKQQWNSMKQRSETPWTKNQYKKIDISVVNVPDSRCFIGIKQCVSWPWNTLFHPDSRCFMTMKHCFILIRGVSWPCFILIEHVSRCFTTMKQIVSLLIHPDLTCFITVSSLFHHCFITVSPVGTSLYWQSQVLPGNLK